MASSIENCHVSGVWVHAEGSNTPEFDEKGYVTGPDKNGTIISDMNSLLDAAKAKNILVIFVLWNGAMLSVQKTIDLFLDKGKLQTYINNALMVFYSIAFLFIKLG